MAIPSQFTVPPDVVSHTAIAAHVRQQIVAGVLEPSHRLPTRSELRGFYRATNDTVQRAFDLLIAQGFIRTEGSRGSFVVAYPPHLHHYALVFPNSQSKMGHSQFWNRLIEQAARVADGPSRRISLYYEVDEHFDSDDARRLLYDAGTQQLAGIIFAYNPEFVAQTPLLRLLDVPMVAMMSRGNELGVPALVLDWESFFVRALTAARDAGCKRVGIIRSPGLAQNLRESTFAAAASLNLETHPYWWLSVQSDWAETARACAHLMLIAPAGERPDAIIVADDNLLEQVLLGVEDAGLRAVERIDRLTGRRDGRQVKIIGHANFPVPPSAVPVQRLGFDAQEIILTAISLLDLQRANELVPVLTSMPATFQTADATEPSSAFLTTASLP